MLKWLINSSAIHIIDTLSTLIFYFFRNVSFNHYIVRRELKAIRLTLAAY